MEAILFAWHERQISAHLRQLAEVRDQAGDAGRRLGAVLEAYALIVPRLIQLIPPIRLVRRFPPLYRGKADGLLGFPIDR